MKNALTALRDHVGRIVESAGLPAAQYALARDGEIVAFESFGEATEDSRFCIFSATKPIFAALAWHLLGEGTLRMDLRVRDVWPEFGQHNKDGITVEHLLLHTAGVPAGEIPRDDHASAERRAEVIAGWELGWEPGSRFEYHRTSAHWVLAEVIRRITGEDHRTLLRRRILDPIGLKRLELGVPEAQQGNILRVRSIGQEKFDLFEVLTGEPTDRAAADADTSWVQSLSTDPFMVEVGVPGGNAISDAAALSLFYQELLHNKHGIWNPDILHTATTDLRNTMPDMFGTPANRTIGLVVAGEDKARLQLPHLDIDISLRPFGDAVSSRTFGHGGYGGQTAWADPESGISFTFLTNGADRDVIAEAERLQHLGSLATAVAE